jgi:hypothetical protein
VKTARGRRMEVVSWPLGAKSQLPSAHEREYFVLVAVPDDEGLPRRDFVLPRLHVAAAAWISHTNWLTEPGIPAGKRNAPVDRARVLLPVFADYEGRWDLLHVDESEAPALLPPVYRELAQDPRVGLPDGHRWKAALPDWWAGRSSLATATGVARLSSRWCRRRRAVRRGDW